MNDITMLTVIEPYQQKALESIANQTFRRGRSARSSRRGAGSVRSTSAEQLRKCTERAKIFSIDHHIKKQHRILNSIMGAPA